MTDQPRMTRRTFHARTSSLAASGAAAMSAMSGSRVLGANERIRCGFIGVANRGGQLLKAFSEHSDCQIAAVCDIDDNTLDAAAERFADDPRNARPARHRDFRELIERDDLDAVVIATPDHWHAIQTIRACKAGKDVYVEKPLSVTVVEGRAMVEAARQNDRVVQVGTHRRSSALYHELAKLVQGGKLGKVTVSRSYRLSNMYPGGIGKLATSDPPAGLDWDMWLGPRPMRPYQDNIAPYKFRWWQQYSSQMGNWGVHFLDAIRWMTDEVAPSSVCTMGGQYAVDDDRTVPDTAQAMFEFASGRLAIFGQYETCGNPALARPGEIEFRGTLGTCTCDGRQFSIIPERPGQFAGRIERAAAMERTDDGGNASLTARHARNFLDCMRSRERPNADVEIGHRSTTFSLLANISLAVGERLTWDADAERITNHTAANELLHYEYRAPWSLD